MAKARKPADTPKAADETAVGHREGAVSAREETATLRERAAGVREEAADRRDDTASVRDDAAGVRDEGADRRDDTATLREDAAGVREEAAGLREETSRLREQAVRAREDAALARAELEELMLQAREANERLVVATVRAQTMSDDAEQANHLKDEFLATVSHELRTPLNAVMGWARMLGSMQLSPERAKHALTIIERNAAILAHLIEDLLDVSRIVAGTLHLAPQPVDLVAVAQAAIDAVQPLALAAKVDVRFSHNPEAIEPVSGDPDRLQQVLWNLLANAIKFTPAGGRVDLFIQPSNDDHIELSVVDTGQGISADFLPHVFERFRQAHGAPTRRHGGLGVGLAIVRQLVELHGGTVRAASEGLGRGATFTVRLPIAADDRSTARRAAFGDRRLAESGASPVPRMPRLDGLRILIVDDDADGRALTSLVLTQAGATVTTAASVREALEMLDTGHPDALVSDLGLPDEDGYALIRQLRQHEKEHGGFLPAVALTGYARSEDRVRVLAAGFQAHVPKPVEPVELASVIADVTRLRGGR
jgi:signal transduction histidine kinase